MDRLAELRRHVRTDARGIEIAPYFNPIVRKSDGYDVMVVDVFDTDRLLRNAEADPNVPKNRICEIEAVDIVCDASGIGEEIEARGLSGRLDYIVSSHNFEHLPNPIRFLQGCGRALRDGGTLTMAIPDYRACFDHFRMPTRLADWLTAFHEDRRLPSPATLFDAATTYGAFNRGRTDSGSCHLRYDDPSAYVVAADIRKAYGDFVARQKGDYPYQDAHCSTLFGELFECLILDLRQIGLIQLELIEVTETRRHEFFVHLRKVPEGSPVMAHEAYLARRMELLRKINANLGSAVYANRPWKTKLLASVWRYTRKTIDVAARMAGPRLTDRVRGWNRRRKARRKAARARSGSDAY